MVKIIITSPSGRSATLGEIVRYNVGRLNKLANKVGDFLGAKVMLGVEGVKDWPSFFAGVWVACMAWAAWLVL